MGHISLGYGPELYVRHSKKEIAKKNSANRHTYLYRMSLLLQQIRFQHYWTVGHISLSYGLELNVRHSKKEIAKKQCEQTDIHAYLYKMALLLQQIRFQQIWTVGHVSLCYGPEWYARQSNCHNKWAN